VAGHTIFPRVLRGGHEIASFIERVAKLTDKDSRTVALLLRRDPGPPEAIGSSLAPGAFP